MSEDRSFIDVLDEVWTSIAAVCASLTADDWDLPTDCPGWTVRDQVSHLIGIESALSGVPAPPPAPEGLPHVKSPFAQAHEAWVEARRSLPGADVLREFRSVTAARLDALRAMSDDDLRAPTDSPIGTVPYGAFMDVRIMDCWVHEQDVRRAVGRPGSLDGRGAAVTVHRLIGTLGFVVGKRVSPPDGTSVTLSVTGPTPAIISVAVEAGRAHVVDPPDRPTVHLSVGTEAFVCLAAGRWDAETALASGQVNVAGDETIGYAILSAMATMP